MKYAGFSLVELSIVLVILGLLTGGILSGQALIRASELRSVTSDYTRYTAAVTSFRDKFFALPGDMTKATSFWGALDGNDGIGVDCRGESASQATCNGDGDARICQSNSCGTPQTYESALFWKHLANAGLIEGSFSGNLATNAGNTICVSSTDQYLRNCNTPGSKLPNGLWTMYYVGRVTSYSVYFDGEYGNMLMLNGGGLGSGGNDILKPEEAWNIDTKLDDGLPATGRVSALRWNICATGASSQADLANGRYALSNSSVNCKLLFRNVF